MVRIGSFTCAICRIAVPGKTESAACGSVLTATAVVWSGEEFSGESLLLTADSREQQAFAALPMKIQSLDIRCDAGAETQSR